MTPGTDDPQAGDRIRLRRWRDADRAPFAALNADRRVMEFFPSRPDRRQSDALVDRFVAHFAEHGFGLWAVELPGVAPFIGFVGLSVPGFAAHFTPCVEIGWRLRREHWGRGYATEAAAELLRFGLGDAGLDRVVSIRHVDNARSERVMNKLGLRFEFQATVPATGQPVAVHAITRHELAVHNGDGTA